MRFGILGPLRVGDGEATVTAGRDRTVLAVLLLRPNRIVPAEELVDAVWDEHPPATARAQLQTCVSRLRRRFAQLGVPPEVIVTDPVGYGVRTGPDDLDAEIFDRRVNAARAALAAGRLAEARGHFRAALALWRGPALGGIPSRTVRRRAQALDEHWLAAFEECVDVELRLGRPAELLDELTEAIDRHPLRERLRGQLMLALSAVGRQADALAVYRDGRRLYAEELGIEPGTALQELHQRVLVGDLALAGRERQPVTAVHCLPRAIPDFTGREDTLTRLTKEIQEDGTRVQLIDGMAGSGKTTLAIHLATALGDRYPDAQLFIDLHGHSEREPVTPAAALAGLLRQLGVPGERIPADEDERAALWRGELADRRAVVVLDNAASAAQVAPLLPSGRHTLTLITSRRRLTGLDEGRPSSLAVLDQDEGVELLARVVGPERVAAEPEAAAEVVRRCGHLPLAIRLAGARLAHRPRWRIADLAARLADGPGVLTEVGAGQRTVVDAFALSYEQVGASAQRMYRMLGLHPGESFDAPVAAALTGLSLTEARHLVDELVDAHLVDEPEPGRYRFHDLMREYARLLAASRDSEEERRGALVALFDHHLHTAWAVSAPVEPATSRIGTDFPDPLRPDLVEAALPEGLTWLTANRVSLRALVLLAEQTGELRYCWQLARAGWYFGFYGGHLDELIDTHTVGLRAAERLGDEAAMATMRNYLASAYYRLGRFPEAIELMEVALRLRQRLGDRRGVATIHRNLALAYAMDRRFAESMRHSAAALPLLRETGQPSEIVAMLNNEAVALLAWGRYEEAQTISRQQLLLARESGQQDLLSHAVGHLGAVRARLGDYDGALRRLHLALRLKRRLANRMGAGEVLNDIGVIERILGRPEAAAARHREAFVLFTQVGDRIAAFAARNLLGYALLAQGDATSALDLHRRVLADATRLNARYEQGRALDGIARCLRPSDPAAARTHWTRALALFRQAEAPERHEVERLLAELG
ncbi:AfsR/SARP family transcriptional regulator [Micromonospora sp. NPDC049366]|uniref:AfsR/SARP family transcriptional regulator n=1 Tax=Micromonospora sp. NPDC049366 TaxID=3364271 RepID=UPI003795044E